jgi:hypothetical protein
MTDNFKNWTLTNTRTGVWLDAFHVNAADVGLAGNWSVKKATLRAGPSDGIDILDVDNGALRFSVLPTRGMGLWRGEYRGMRLGWQPPLSGPVHPKFVNADAHGGIGWLAGFDEWMCRCGLAWNGPPGDDGGAKLTLHGRIANLPASHVAVGVQTNSPHTIAVQGVTHEGGLFLANLRLTTHYYTEPGAHWVQIHDTVENLSSRPAELQMLYHCNWGPPCPVLEEGSKVLAPFRTVAPLTPRAAEGIDTFDVYGPPTPGFAEQVYACQMLEDSQGWTLALVQNPAADKGAVVYWRPRELPCFTIWKNTAAVEDGYVTGLEPATNFPNFKGFERQQGRVIVLPPGGSWECTWGIEVYDTAEGVATVHKRIADIEHTGTRVVNRVPTAGFCPV